MIELNGLQKYYNKGKQNEIHVINNVSMSIPETGMCAIFGPSGCGKTTLLNVIGGLDSYESGILTIDGLSMEQKTDLLRNRYIGFIFQNYYLNKEETVFENVSDSLLLCGMRDEEEIRRRVMAALANVGMDKFSKRYPDTLSGGQQQRVAIARAIVKNPKIILADEPTGNLDEANTVLVMDILKEMSKEHLVLLVTHEEQLVDYYCDTVIELKDGSIVGTKVNESANGYAVKNKNDVYLGEYESEDIGNAEVSVRYYGDKPEEPLKLTVVNHNGRLLLRIDTPKVAVIDEFSELKLHDGVYTVQEQQQRQRQEFDMSELPPFEGSNYGKLFDFKTSVKRGYNVNFKSLMTQKGKKRLRRTLALFSIVFVFMSALFGTGIREYLRLNEKYDRNIFYVYAENDNVGERMQKALTDSSSGIDFVTVRNLSVSNRPTEANISFSPSGFESFGYYSSGRSIYSDVSLNAFVLPYNVLSDAKTLAGSSDDCQKEGKVIISKLLADRILREFPYEYIKSYEDLLGVDCAWYYGERYYSSSDAYRIGCVVDSDENAIFVEPMLHAAYSMYGTGEGIQGVLSEVDGHFGITRGEVIFVRNYPEGSDSPEYGYDIAREASNFKVGDTIRVHGMDFRIGRIIDAVSEYNYRFEDYRMSMISPQEYKRYFDSEQEIQEFKEYCAGREAYEKIMQEIKDNTYLFNDAMSMDDLSFVILNREDFIECSSRSGLTPGAFFRNGNMYYTYELCDPCTAAWDYKPYYAVHATDVKAAEKYLKENFSDITAPSGLHSYEPKAVYTTKDIRNLCFAEFRGDIVPILITLLIIVGFMSLCMYFIMKSMIMNRSKEIGIYRAIGVTRKNVIFRFAVEAGVVVSFSIFIGYLIGSAASLYVQANTTLFYYPIWYALLILAFLYALGIFCGIIPVLMILRKTPSAILAQYDI